MTKRPRKYSTVVRIVAGAVGVLLFLPTAILAVAILIKFEDMRNMATVTGLLGACGAVFVLLKIATTGTSTAFLEQRVGIFGDDEAVTSDSDRRE